ncbi:MAG: ATP-dependent DNA helicase RecG [Dehalococcoidia bacterium]
MDREIFVATIKNILNKEITSNFDNSVVIGGLDLFLDNYHQHLVDLDAPKFTRYELFSHFERKIWVDSFIKLLDGGSKSSHRTLGSVKNNRKVKPQALVTELNYPRRGNTVRILNEKQDISTVFDLLVNYPIRHDDFSSIRKIKDLLLHETQSVIATVWGTSLKTGRSGAKRIDITVSDETGNMNVSLFNQVWAMKELKQGVRLIISGRAIKYRGRITIDNPTYEILRNNGRNIHTGRLVPVYSLSSGINQKTLRRLVYNALSSSLGFVEEFLPRDLIAKTGLMNLADAIYRYHYPENKKELLSARRRLAFDELFVMQLVSRKRRIHWKTEGSAIPLHDHTLLKQFLSSLPFDLTVDQQKVIGEISKDMSNETAMGRLLQGDVGSGKTVVAAAAMITAVSSGKQSALMAPTEVLAEQHFQTLSSLLVASKGMKMEMREDGEFENIIKIEGMESGKDITLALLIGSLNEKVKNITREKLASGDIDIVVGTHALIQESVDIPNLAMLVVDEQHRFGLVQRSLLLERHPRPHMLVMSATPIPRSLALAMAGELDISVINEMPVGRKPIRTIVESSERRENIYKFIKEQIKEGRQAFIVFSLIDDSESIQARAAASEYERLSFEVFPELNLGLLHGRMSLTEKENVMDDFKAGKLDILLATAVVEVGIDVPNASVMLIDGAERFGLSQMHQFRGRVGRGEFQSHCILVSDSPGEEARNRMEILRRTSDGFKLAEEDLKIRGPGDYIGTRQSGAPIFKVAQISDTELMELAGIEAERILEHDPNLESADNTLLRDRYDSLIEDLKIS